MLARKIQSLSADLCIKNLCHPVLYCFISVSSFLLQDSLTFRYRVSYAIYDII